MKKLFTLLTLLICAVTGTWATDYYTPTADEVIILNDIYDESSAPYSTHAAVAWGGTASTSGKKAGDPNNNGELTSSNVSCFSIKGNGKGKNITLNIAGCSKVILYHEKNSSRYPQLKATPEGGSLTKLDGATNVTYNEFELDGTASYSILLHGTDTDSKDQDFYVYAIKLVKASADAPSLLVAPSTLSFSLTPKKPTDTQKFTITGRNLKNGTYNLDIPSVAGLSVSPTSFTVADGAVNQEFGVTYASSEDVEKNTVNITTPEINGKSVTVAVTYKSRATLFTQTITSEAATWDWSKVSGADRVYDEEEPEVYSNFDEYTFGDGFNAHAWMIYSSPNMLYGGALRLGKIGLKTSVPGTLTVDFSDTGNKSGTGEGTKRYLAVNDVPTQYYTNRQEGTDDNKSHKQTGVVVNVPAGVVTISSSNSYIALYKVVFTPEASPASSVSATLSASGLSSFCSAYALDFSGVTGLKAYVVTAVTSTSVTLTQVDKVPGGTGVILQGTAGETYTIPVAATIPDAPATNKMVGTLNATNVSANSAYALKDGKFHPVNAGTIAAGKAYLPASAVPASAPELAIVFDGQTTGIQGVEAQKQVENGVFYNLAGQRVAQPTKGLYIVNGKKVVMK